MDAPDINTYRRTLSYSRIAGRRDTFRGSLRESIDRSVTRQYTRDTGQFTTIKNST